MPNLITVVTIAVAAALVVAGAYHAFVATPRFRRLQTVLDAHDALLGGGSARAVERLTGIDRAIADGAAAREEATRRIAALEKVAHAEIPRVGFLRYNAFSDVGSELSFALALLNRDGDGVVLNSIWSREETRTYGKAVKAFKPAQDSSEEELAAIAKARAAAS